MKNIEKHRTLVLNFQVESNKIEGISGAKELEVDALVSFLHFDQHNFDTFEKYLAVVQPNAQLRNKKGMDVFVGSHIPPAGGEAVESDLFQLIEHVNHKTVYDPYDMHHRFETLHPYTDGNGRLGRALWLWKMQQSPAHDGRRALERGFLHTWYYQSLSAGR